MHPYTGFHSLRTSWYESIHLCNCASIHPVIYEIRYDSVQRLEKKKATHQIILISNWLAIAIMTVTLCIACTKKLYRTELMYNVGKE